MEKLYCTRGLWAFYVRETPVSRSNCKQGRVENRPAKPFERQPSTEHKDLGALRGELCLLISVQSSPQFAALYDSSLPLFTLIGGFRFVLTGKMLTKDPKSSFSRSSGNFLFKPGKTFNPAIKPQYYKGCNFCLVYYVLM